MNLEQLKHDAALCGRPIDDEQAAKLQETLGRDHPGLDTGDIPLRCFVSALSEVRGEH